MVLLCYGLIWKSCKSSNLFIFKIVKTYISTWYNICGLVHYGSVFDLCVGFLLHCDRWSFVSCNKKSTVNHILRIMTFTVRFLTICCSLLFIQAAGSEEGEVTGRGAIAAGKGELWVLWTGQDAAAAGRHHQPAGQGLHHPAHHQLPEDEGFRQPGRPAVEPAHGGTAAQHLCQR